MTPDDELSAAARQLHREWDSPRLWPAIAGEIARAERARRHWWLAAAAVILIGASASILLIRDRAPGDTATPSGVTRSDGRLLSDEALLEVEQAEAQYVAAIEALAVKATGRLEEQSSPMAANLRERLLVIDAAIADCRAEVERNRFNTHLRRQLLAMYQEKRRTLEQILEQERHVS